MSDKPTSADKFLHGEAMAGIRTELGRQARMLEAVRRCLPEFLAEHCRHCVVKDEQLLIYVDAPSWGAQLRFCLPDLRVLLARSTGQDFRQIQVRTVVPAESLAVKKPSSYVPPSPSANQAIQEAIEASPHEDIREALRRLSLALERAREEQG